MRSFPPIRRFAAGCVLALVLAGCAGLIPPPAAVGPARVKSLVEMNWRNPDFVILDLRGADDYARGHLQGAVNIPFGTSTFRDELARLDRGKTYVVYCRAGGLSIETREMMRRMGFSEVTVMEGGYLAWRRAGFRTVR